MALTAAAQPPAPADSTHLTKTTTMANKMKIEVWSDVVCPFCYIGKRKWEAALAQFPHRDKVELVWKSFLLSPDTKTDTTKDAYTALAEHKGISVQQSRSMHDNVTKMAQDVGLAYHFDKAIPANSFRAHCFLHLAAKHGKQNEAKEALFRSYFTDGKNIDDITTLVQLGQEIGLSPEEVKNALESSLYADEVQQDVEEARQLDVNGVPFFVFDRKYAISGAQDSKVFLQTLEKAYSEWLKANPQAAFDVIEGPVCKPDQECD